MGAPGPTADPCLKSVLQWQRLGDAAMVQINFWSYSGGPPNAATLNNLANNIVNQAEAAFASVCDTHTGVLSCVLTDISQSPVVQGEGGSPWVGTRAGDPLAPGTAFIINKKPENPYRGGKPKNFLPFGVGGDVATTGLWATTPLGDFETAYDTFQTAVAGSSYGGTFIEAEVMVSYYTGGSTVTISPTTGRARNTPKKRKVGDVWTPVVLGLGGTAGSKLIGSQRKRNRNA